jgi:hypothetical protein
MVFVENRRTGLALGEDPEDGRTAGEDERFPESPRALVITATASRSLAKLSGVPSTCPMLAVLTMASTWAAGAARLTGSAKSPKTGIKPADRSFAAAESDRDKARISWRCCDSFRAMAAPINPVAPVTRIFMVPPSANQMPILAWRHWVWRELQHGQQATPLSTQAAIAVPT